MVISCYCLNQYLLNFVCFLRVTILNQLRNILMFQYFQVTWAVPIAVLLTGRICPSEADVFSYPIFTFSYAVPQIWNTILLFSQYKSNSFFRERVSFILYHEAFLDNSEIEAPSKTRGALQAYEIDHAHYSICTNH